MPEEASPIICPMEKYMRTTKNMSDAISLLRSFGVSCLQAHPALPLTALSCYSLCHFLILLLCLWDSLHSPPALPPPLSAHLSRFLDSHRVGQKADRAARHTINLRDRLFHSGRACRTAHSCNCILLHTVCISFFLLFESNYSEAFSKISQFLSP